MPKETQAGTLQSAILTVKEVSEYLRISEAKVYRLVKVGALPVVRIGKTWRFRKDLLDRWLQESSEVQMHVSLPGPGSREE